MTLALVQYVVGQKHLEGAGELKGEMARPENIAQAKRSLRRVSASSTQA